MSADEVRITLSDVYRAVRDLDRKLDGALARQASHDGRLRALELVVYSLALTLLATLGGLLVVAA